MLRLSKSTHLSPYQSANLKPWVLLEQSVLHCVYYIKLYPCTSKQELEQGETNKVNFIKYIRPPLISTETNFVFINIWACIHLKQSAEFGIYCSWMQVFWHNRQLLWWSGNRSMRKSRFIGIILAQGASTLFLPKFSPSSPWREYKITEPFSYIPM